LSGGLGWSSQTVILFYHELGLSFDNSRLLSVDLQPSWSY